MNLRDIVHRDAKKETKISWAWYEHNVRNAAARMSAQKFLGNNQAHQIDKKGVTPGDILMFFYSPKYKDTLKIYDTFPLVLPFSVSDDGKRFTGINLHYLKPVDRAILLEKLMQYVSDDKLSYGAKIEAAWSIIQAAAGTKMAEHCVKQYLFTHIKSKVIVIPPKEWKFVIWLPLCRFQKGSNSTAWSGY